MRKNLMLLLTVWLVLGFTGCPTEDEEGGGRDSGVDFTNYKSDFSIKVQNNTSKRLIAFNSSPNASVLIGGIPVGGGEHGLPKPSGMFTETKDFILFLVTEEDYKINKNNLSALANVPFATILAYYNSNSINYVVYPINQYLGGDKTIRIDNDTFLNMELRLDGVNGPILGYAKAYQRNVNLKVDAGDYTVFPVFRAIERNRQEIITIHPRVPDGQPGAGNVRRIQIPLNNTDPTYIIEANKYYNNDYVYVTGSAFLTIINNNAATGLEFIRGGSPLLTSTGGRFIRQGGNSMTFQIDMPRIGSGDQYQNSLHIAAGGLLLSGGGDSVSLPAFTFESEKTYQLNVVGINEYDIRFPDGIVETGTIDIKSIFSF